MSGHPALEELGPGHAVWGLPVSGLDAKSFPRRAHRTGDTGIGPKGRVDEPTNNRRHLYGRVDVMGDPPAITAVRGILLSAPTLGGFTVAEQSWTHTELLSELAEFERELRAAGLRDSSVRTYTDRTTIFLRWLVGDYTPRGPKY